MLRQKPSLTSPTKVTKTTHARSTQNLPAISDIESKFFGKLVSNRKEDKLEQQWQRLQNGSSLKRSPTSKSNTQVHLGDMLNKFDEMYSRYWIEDGENIALESSSLSTESPNNNQSSSKIHDRPLYNFQSNSRTISKPLRTNKVVYDQVDNALTMSIGSQDFMVKTSSELHADFSPQTRNEENTRKLLLFLEGIEGLGVQILERIDQTLGSPCRGREKARDATMSKVSQDINLKVLKARTEIESLKNKVFVDASLVKSQVKYRAASGRRCWTMDRKSVNDKGEEDDEMIFAGNYTDRKATSREIDEIVDRLYSSRKRESMHHFEYEGAQSSRSQQSPRKFEQPQIAIKPPQRESTGSSPLIPPLQIPREESGRQNTDNIRNIIRRISVTEGQIENTKKYIEKTLKDENTELNELFKMINHTREGYDEARDKIMNSQK